MNKEELKSKFLQLFILGYKTETPSKSFINLIKQGLGGIIFFAENLKSRSKFKNLVKILKSKADIPLFLSIDQEGGLVERTIFLDEKIEYLTQKALSKLKNKEDIKKHYDILAKDLKDLGINFNFAPVLDVNTKPANPIIGVRAFGDNPDIVCDCEKYVIEAFKENHIITCGKHFAGHGDTDVDSHLNMPIVNLSYETFFQKHLPPFIDGIKDGIDTIMVSHVWFPFFNEQKLPASLSTNIIDGLLKTLFGFKGLIISDDMVMGGVSKNYGTKESIINALMADIDVLIFRNATEELLTAIDEVVDFAMTNTAMQNIIEERFNKIAKFKKTHIFDDTELQFSVSDFQKEIERIAKDTIVLNKKGNLLPLDKNKNIKIISFNNKEIFNLSTREKNLSDYLSDYNVEEINYPIRPDEKVINKILNSLQNDDVVIFLSYNAQINTEQITLFEKITNPKILVSCGLDYDVNLLGKTDSIISLNCAKLPSIKALSELLTDK